MSVNERVPEAAPTAVGVKVSATVHVPAAATAVEVKQVVPEVAMAKGPVVAIAVKVRLEMPVFVTVTVCAGLAVPTGSDGKVGAADKLTTGPFAVPVPLKLTVCVLPAVPPALSVMVTAPVRAPVAVGLKVTLIVQFAPAARLEVLAGQLLVCEKSLEPALTAMLAIVRAAVPVLVRVTD